ncbi:MAG TPA: Xaa-Pro peptidase family protein [Acidobacteriaceae bacterium]|nr:Xaa-Pro peptidase family protein [Acidobacteriaceae bacterium]
MKPIVHALVSLLLLATPVMAVEKQPASEYHARRVHLSQTLNGGNAVLFANEEPVTDLDPFRQDSDFYYLTGWSEPGAALLIQAASGGDALRPARAYREVLFLPTRDRIVERYTGPKLDAASPNVTQITGVDEVEPMTALPSILGTLIRADRSLVSNLWSEPDMPQARALAGWLATTLGMDTTPALQNVRSLTPALRALKDPGELALLHQAADASVQAQRTMIKAIHPGMNERTAAGILIASLMAHGCERPSYAPIFGSGPNSTILHYSANSRTMESGDVLLVDAAGEYSMYAADITRTMPVNGRFTARQREIYNVVLGAQQAAMAAFVAGQSRINDPYHRYSDSLDTVAFNYMNAHGKDLHGDGLGKYFIHGIGHLVGLDVHDPWDYTKPIEKGMVFTIEPGIYIPEEKIGVRIEDDFYVKADGSLECLTCALPRTADAIEALMKH